MCFCSLAPLNITMLVKVKPNKRHELHVFTAKINLPSDRVARGCVSFILARVDWRWVSTGCGHCCSQQQGQSPWSHWKERFWLSVSSRYSLCDGWDLSWFLNYWLNCFLFLFIICSICKQTMQARPSNLFWWRATLIILLHIVAHSTNSFWVEALSMSIHTYQWYEL